MEELPSSGRLAEAQQQFRAARLRATIENIWARMVGRSVDLVPFDEVRERLGARRPVRRTRERVPLSSIIGSVGRYSDFTRSFLPRRDSNESRWTAVRLAAQQKPSLPPIELYRLGEAYFVLDGNHRVSVARHMGMTEIDALVTEIEARVPLTPSDRADDIIIKAELAEFLEYTGFDELFPEVNLTITVPGQYRTLMEMIDIEHYYLSRDAGEKLTYDVAVLHWFREVYTPTVAYIGESGLLRHFPGRTETDLYAWIARNRTDISRRLGWTVDTQAVAEDLVESRRSSSSVQRLGRLTERLTESLLPGFLETAPQPGRWRKQWLPTHRTPSLFQDLLVIMAATEEHWRAFEQAFILASHQRSRIHGLHVMVEPDSTISDSIRSVRSEFERRAAALGLHGEFQLLRSDHHPSVADTILERARWADLIVVPTHLQTERTVENRISPTLSHLLRRLDRPMLTVPAEPSPLQRPLLAYDGSLGAREALYVACYLSGRIWDRLHIVTVKEGPRMSADILGEALEYAQRRGVSVETYRQEGDVADAILKTAGQVHADLIVLGGSSRMALFETFLGSPGERILRSSPIPTLICR